ncbi:helix-turn-helix transcriptional regulator [Phenylobacterium sp.]|uniref:helix-turn-helix transcriptional regulator n=1 Tax=Phenylobacterium sp. TaxID=1871053 RepID=UPI0035B0BE4C
MTKKRNAKRSRPTMAAALRGAPLKGSQLPDPGAVEDALASVEPLQLLTPEEAASILAVTKRTLEYWRMTGEGPRFLKLSRATIRYTAADLAAFQAACGRKNTA